MQHNKSWKEIIKNSSYIDEENQSYVFIDLIWNFKDWSETFIGLEPGPIIYLWLGKVLTNVRRC